MLRMSETCYLRAPAKPSVLCSTLGGGVWPSNQLCKFAQVQLFGRASGCVSTATVRSSKLRYGDR